MSTPPPRCSAKSSREAGFTLLELSLVMSILGLIMLTGFASFENFRMYVMRTSCVQQQRNITTPALLYGFENGIMNQDVSSVALVTANTIAPELGECPMSDTFDSADYLLIYQNGELFDVDCNVMGLQHAYHR